MPRIVLSLLFLLLISVKPVFADVAEDVKEYNKKSLPPAGSEIDISGISISNTPAPEKTNESYEYDLAEDKIEETPRDIRVWFQKILDFFQDLFGQGVTDVGNRNAQNFLNARLPQGVGEQMIARVNNTSELAQNNNTNVLGTVSNEAMDYAYGCTLCGSLPPGLCTCGPSPTPIETPSPTPVSPSGFPTPTGGVSAFPTTYPIPSGQDYYRDTGKCRPHDYIKSPVTLPSVCRESPSKFDKDSTISNGSCLIPDKGFCSPLCLKPFFGNDIVMAKKAAMICYKESGGDTYDFNDGCLNSISNEYSVGLFQINLKNEDSNNPWTQTPRSYQCRGTVIPVGQISCKAGPNIDSCRSKFQIPEINIPEAWNLWYDRYLYYTDLCTVYGGGLKWIWRGWTAAYPEHCDIKY